MNEAFMRRYIKRNARILWSMEAWNIAHFKNGRGIARFVVKKDEIIQEYEKNELQDFLNGGKLNIPQLQFFLTDRCTLSCKDCNAFIPSFKKDFKPYWLTPEAMQKDLTALEMAVKSIRFFIFIGGEPLLHPKLHMLLDIAMHSPIIDKLVIISNGTVIPSAKVLDALIKYKDRIYIRVSDYSASYTSREKAACDKLRGICGKNKLRFIKETIPWIKVGGFEVAQNREQAKEYFRICPFERCGQVWEGKMSICPKANAGYMLGKLDPAGETVNLRDPENLRQRLIDFYCRDCFEACLTCEPHGKAVPIAEQAR